MFSTRLISKIVPVLLVTAMIPAFTGCGYRTIDEGERGVVTSMGKMKKETLDPGFHTYNPVTDEITTYIVKQQKVDGVVVPLTKDQQDITIKYAVWFRIPEKNVGMIYSQYQGDPYHTLVEPQVQEAFRSIVSQYKAEEVIHQVDTVKTRALAMIKEGLKGVLEVRDIPITDITLPKSLQSAIEKKQVEEQRALGKQYELDKEKKQAEITITQAQAKAKAMQLEAQALRSSPELVRLRWIEKWDGELPATVLGSDTSVMYTK